MPGGKGNIKGSDGNTFSSTNQPENRGRKPKIFSELSAQFKERGIEKATAATVSEVFQYLLSIPLHEIIQIAGKPEDKENDYPAILRIAAAEMIGRRRREILDSMLDRANGKATQPVETNSTVTITGAGAITPEQAEAMAKIINGGGGS